MISREIRPDQLIKDSLMVSIIDGSLIDLKHRDHLDRLPPTAHSPPPALGRRSFQAFDYIRKKYLNPFRKFNRIRKNKYLNYQTNLPKIKEMMPCPDMHLTKQTLLLQNMARPAQANGNFKKTKFKLEKIAENALISAKRSIASPMGMISTMSFQSKKCAKKTFFPSFPKTRDIENKSNLKSLETPQSATPKLNPNLKTSIQKQTQVPPQRYRDVLAAMLRMYQARLHSGRLQQEQVKFESVLARLDLRLNCLDGFQNLLLKFLLGRRIDPADLRVSDLEAVLFLLFLVKKKFKILDGLEWTCDSLNAVRAAGVNKRSEQNYKIILKRFFKKVIRDFNRRRALDLKDDFEFYRFHFAEISEKLNHDWRKLRFEIVFNEKRVCFSVEYQRQSKKLFARILKRSRPFMKLLEEYLASRLVIEDKTHGIVVDYMPILRKKIFQLIGKWGDEFNRKGLDLERKLSEFVLDKMENNKVKLPWSMVEIEQGILNVRRLFQRAE